MSEMFFHPDISVPFVWHKFIWSHPYNWLYNCACFCGKKILIIIVFLHAVFCIAMVSLQLEICLQSWFRQWILSFSSHIYGVTYKGFNSIVTFHSVHDRIMDKQLVIQNLKSFFFSIKLFVVFNTLLLKLQGIPGIVHLKKR